MQKLCPTMYSRFTRLLDAIGTADETKITDEIYQTLEPLNFSTAFLEKFADTVRTCSRCCRFCRYRGVIGVRRNGYCALTSFWAVRRKESVGSDARHSTRLCTATE